MSKAKRQAKRKGRNRRTIKDEILRLRVSPGLKAALQREAHRDQRAVANLARKLMIDGLTARGAFAPKNGSQ